MRIGLFFGSFNPIHVGHLIIANHVLNETEIKKVWFVVSPQNPLKSSTSLLHENHRIRLVRMAVEDDNRLFASNAEFDLPRPSYTIDTLTYISSAKPKPDAVIHNNIIPGRMKRFLAENTLLGQAFVINPDVTVEQAAKDAGVEITGYARVAVGEGVEKKQEDFAAEVAKALQG